MSGVTPWDGGVFENLFLMSKMLIAVELFSRWFSTGAVRSAIPGLLTPVCVCVCVCRGSTPG